MKAGDVYEAIREKKIITIIRGAEEGVIVKIAEALFAGGIEMLEVTCNTPGFASMIRALKEAMEGKMLIGAGTVISVDLAKQALAAGAEYAIAPDTNPDVISYCVENDVAVVPGAATPTEVLTAKRYGAKMVKIFPASALGADYIRQLRGPIDDVEFVAVGGVTPANVREFMRAGCIGIGIGGSVAKKAHIAAGNWAGISAAAREFAAAINGS
jgi:2-dehydro-3-deoxyphosphogluconate aldolase/(4S)-4-hydroxy-2-oxoglutarate aldolase